MHALSTSAPQMGQSHDMIQDSLPSPSAPPMAGEQQDRSTGYPRIWHPSEGEHTHDNFPIVGLTREITPLSKV